MQIYKTKSLSILVFPMPRGTIEAGSSTVDLLLNLGALNSENILTVTVR